MRWTLSLRLLGTEVLAATLASPAPATSTPPAHECDPAGRRDVVVQDFSDTTSQPDSTTEYRPGDETVPFGFAVPVKAVPTESAPYPLDDDEVDTTERRFGFR